jgi:hypothetical protein
MDEGFSTFYAAGSTRPGSAMSAAITAEPTPEPEPLRQPPEGRLEPVLRRRCRLSAERRLAVRRHQLLQGRGRRQKLLGEFDNNIWSAKVGVKVGAHSLAVSHQRNNGNDDFDYLRQSDSIFLNNSIQYSDFNSPKERSWMLRYDLDMQAFGIPGLSFMTRYAKAPMPITAMPTRSICAATAPAIRSPISAAGNGISKPSTWCKAALKDLSLRLRQATVRSSSFESDLEEVRVIVEYPLAVL